VAADDDGEKKKLSWTRWPFRPLITNQQD